MAETQGGLPAPTLYAMATAAGLAVANIYYNQPMLGLIEADLPGRAAALVPTVTQLGYAAGLFLLVPLADAVERRGLIVGQFLCLAAALALAAVAPSGVVLVAASLLVGAAASVAQQIVPFAAHLAAPERRGAATGTVLAGILTGILLSRTLSGFVATHGGWREVFWLGAPRALLGALLMRVALPALRTDRPVDYGALLASTAGLWRIFPELRRAALTQGMIFAAFSAFWTTLAFRLQARFGLDADAAGLFGLVGATGILAAPLAGRLADRRGPRPAVVAGAVLTVAAWLVFGLWPGLAGLVVGVVILDFATQAALVSNQHIVFSLRPEARARLNTVLMGGMFLGGALGSAVASAAWAWAGWTGVTAAGLAFGAAAAALQLVPAAGQRAARRT